jgi:hypothetical protein
MRSILLVIVFVFLAAISNGQCLVRKTGHFFGFFRVTNFKEKECWLSEHFAYDEVNGEIVNYNLMKACFKREVAALGGHVEPEIDEFGKDRVIWLSNVYDPKDELEASCNWNLPSANACVKYIAQEINYKTQNGIKLKIAAMYGQGLISNSVYVR